MEREKNKELKIYLKDINIVNKFLKWEYSTFYNTIYIFILNDRQIEYKRNLIYHKIFEILSLCSNIKTFVLISPYIMSEIQYKNIFLLLNNVVGKLCDVVLPLPEYPFIQKENNYSETPSNIRSLYFVSNTGVKKEIIEHISSTISSLTMPFILGTGIYNYSKKHTFLKMKRLFKMDTPLNISDLELIPILNHIMLAEYITRNEKLAFKKCVPTRCINLKLARIVYKNYLALEIFKKICFLFFPFLKRRVGKDMAKYVFKLIHPAHFLNCIVVKQKDRKARKIVSKYKKYHELTKNYDIDKIRLFKTMRDIKKTKKNLKYLREEKVRLILEEKKGLKRKREIFENVLL